MRPFPRATRFTTRSSRSSITEPASPPGRRGRWSAGTALALLAFVCTFFGAFVADPMRAIHSINAARLRAAGAHTETLTAKDGSHLFVWVLGPLSAERPVVLLHGLGAAADYWTDTALALRRAGRTVILPDAPGSGGSERPRTDAGYTLSARVEALASVADALGLRRFDLVGHSLGGWVAGRFSLSSPERIDRLVLVDSAGFTLPSREEILETRQSLSPRDRTGARHLVDLLFTRRPFPAAGFVVDAFGRNYGARNVFVTVALLGESDGLLGLESRLPRGTVFLWGERDPLFPVADARRASARTRDGRCFVITGVGHDAPLEAPGPFRDALARSLSLAPGEEP